MRILEKSIVVVGKSFQPSTVSESWLIRRGIVRENQIQGNRICTEILSSFTTSVIDFQILPEKTMIHAKDIALDVDVLSSALLLISELPATSFSAVGVNLNWDITPDDANVVDCMKNQIKFTKTLPQELASAALGFVVQVQSIFGSNLRLNVLPVSVDKTKPRHFTKIFADFNFNLDVESETDQRTQVKDFVEHYTDVIEHANRIAAGLL